MSLPWDHDREACESKAGSVSDFAGCEQGVGALSSLQWLAFCYLTGELGEEERREFEMRLERDQLAQDALSSMVLLCEELQGAFAREVISGAISTVPPSFEPLVRPAQASPAAGVIGGGRLVSSIASRPAVNGRGVLVAAAAVCCAVLFAAVAVRHETPQRVGLENGADYSEASPLLTAQARRADRLISLWSESRSGASLFPESDEWGSPHFTEWGSSLDREEESVAVLGASGNERLRSSESSLAGLSRVEGVTRASDSVRSAAAVERTNSKPFLSAELSDGSRVDVPDWLVASLAVTSVPLDGATDE